MRGLPIFTALSSFDLDLTTSSDTSVPTDSFAQATASPTSSPTVILTGSPTASGTCRGTSTFTGYIPLQTITVTVDESYTFHRYGNDSRTPTTIFYTPPPPCESVVVPVSMPSAAASSIPSWESSMYAALGITGIPGSVQTHAALNMTTYTSVFTWTETLTDSGSCAPNLSAAPSTINRGPPYANSSTSTDTAAATSCGPFLRFGTFLTTQTFVSAIPITAGAPGHIRPQNPGAPNEGNTSPGVVTPNQPVSSLVATVTITKKTPVEIRASTTAEQIVFPDSVPSISPIKIGSPPPAKTTVPLLGGANTQKPSDNAPTIPINGDLGGKTRSAVNSNNNDGNPQVPAPTPSAGNDKPASNNNNNLLGPVSNQNSAPSPPQSAGLGSIINSVIHSPFTTIGLVTSYGAASVTANLVNGVPVQVEPSSVYIGGSQVAIPFGSSTALVTVNRQTFTIVSGAVIGGSSTLAIHRSESVSSSPIQAATLAASTVTQNGVVVTIEPTAAIVDGKTYSIGLNADSSKVIVNGQTVTFGSNGVAFASTTYAPAMVTASAYVVTTIGGLTFSIDSSQAIIDGTTYGIGSGAFSTLVTTQIDGTTVTFGPSGIILPSTTIAPTGVSLAGSGVGSAATSGLATARVLSGPTASPTIATGGAITLLPNIPYMISILLALSSLSLGLLL